MILVNDTMIRIPTNGTDFIFIKTFSIFRVSTVNAMVYSSCLRFFIICTKQSYTSRNIIPFIHDNGLFGSILVECRVYITTCRCGSVNIVNLCTSFIDFWLQVEFSYGVCFISIVVLQFLQLVVQSMQILCLVSVCEVKCHNACRHIGIGYKLVFGQIIKQSLILRFANLIADCHLAAWVILELHESVI